MIQGELKLEVWTLIIEKSTVIPPSLMVLFFLSEYLSVEILRMSLEQALRYGAGDLGGDLHRGFYDQRTQALMVKSSSKYHWHNLFLL